MSHKNVCCLCVEVCQDSTSLYDKDSGNPNEAHELMMKYFDVKLLAGFTESHNKDMCLKCWQQISDFNKYQQTVYQAQVTLRIKGEHKQLVIQSDTQLLNIKTENEFLAENVTEQSTEYSISFVKEEPELSLCDSFSTADDDNSETSDNEESDDPSGSKLKELPTKGAEINKDLEELMTQEMRKRSGMSVKASDDLIAQWNPLIDCALCAEKCETYSLLQIHFKAKHRHDKCQVECCGKYFTRRGRYEDHIRLHMDPNAFTCSVCDAPQSCRDSLTRHLREYHPTSVDGDAIDSTNKTDIFSPASGRGLKKSANANSQTSEQNTFSRLKYIKSTDDFIAEMMPVLECELCSEKYSKYSQIRKHFSEKHPGSRCYITCCGRKLVERYRVVDHLRHHANPDVFKCSLCDARYKHRTRLRAHMNKRHNTAINEPDKPETDNPEGKVIQKSKFKELNDLLAKWLPSRECAICKEEFYTLARLKSHFKKCNPKEEFYIECCRRRFNNQRDIEAHVRYHVEPTCYKCDACHICYGHERSLTTHMRDVHETRVSFKCDYCSATYFHKQSLIIHNRKIHSSEKETVLPTYCADNE